MAFLAEINAAPWDNACSALLAIRATPLFEMLPCSPH